MDVKQVPMLYSIALTISFVVILTWVWKVVNWVWFTPKRLERRLRQQGLRGKPYRILFGDMKEDALMAKEAKSKPFGIDDEVVLRTEPLLVQLMKDYGKDCFMWIGPTPRVTIMNPEHIREILTKINRFPKPEPTPILKQFVTGLATYEGPKWSLHRKIITPAYHLEKLKLMVPAMHKSCMDMIDKWESLVSSSKNGACELDAFLYIKTLSSDIISRTAFGSNYEEGKRTFELLQEQTQYALKALESIYIPGWRFMPTKNNRKMKELAKEIQALLKNLIQEREKAMQAGEPTKHDLLGVLMESNSTEMKEHGSNGLSMEDIIEECKLFYFAGYETVSVSLTWTMIYLAKHSYWQDRAREEVVQVFGNKDPDFDRLGRLKVVAMIWHEVLRLYPAIPFAGRAIHKDTQLGDLVLPEGVQIGIPYICVLNDPEIWGDDAKQFNPERFSGGVLKAANNVQAAYLPFGWGPRLCMGQTFSLIQAKMVLAMILRRFSFELSPSYVHAPYRHVTMQLQYGAPLIVRKL